MTDCQTAASEAKVRVGDRLAFRCDYGNDWQVHEVDRITPSGRMSCGPYQLNADLTIRGRCYHGGPYRAQAVTPEIALAVARNRRLSLIARTTFASLSDATIQAIAELIVQDSHAKAEGGHE